MSSAPARHPLPTVTVVSGSSATIPASQSSIIPLAQLSRNASVISSSSSSSSSSSLILNPPIRPRPVRTFSPGTSVSPQRAGSRAQSPLSPGTPRFSRAPTYLQRQLGIGDDVPPDLSLPPPSAPDSSNTLTIGAPMRASLPRETRSRANSGAATRRLYSPEDFEFGDVLGEGSYSTVLSATYRKTGHVYAVKVLDKHHLQRNNKVKYAYVEKDSLARLSTAGHPGLVRLHWAFSDATSLYFVLDKINNGELNTKINLLGSLSTACARYYTAQTIDVISWMHALGVLHRDMKPENCLLDDDMRLKITDFGTAKVLKEDDPESHTSSFVGSPGYISPELLLSYTCGKSADYWAIGCILFQMIAGVQPFKALTPYLSMEKTKTADYSFPSGFDPVAKDLVQNLLIIEPSGRFGDAARGGVPVLKAHPFFDGIDWANLWTCHAPPLEAGIVRKQSKLPKFEDDENKQGMGAAWDALTRDLSEDEMDATEYKCGEIGIPTTNQYPILNEIRPAPHPYFASHDVDVVLTPSTSATPVRGFQSVKGNYGDRTASSSITARLPAFGTGHSNASSRDDIHGRARNWRDKDGASEGSSRTRNLSVDPRPSGSHTRSSLSPLDGVIARDTHYPEIRRGSNQLSSSAPIRGSPISSIAGSADRPSSLGENGALSALSTSPTSTSSGESQPHAKWSKFLLPAERVIFTSPVLVRRRSILPSRTKPRILVLTDFPRIICLKTVMKGSLDMREITERVKIKTEIFFTPPKQLSNSNSWTSITGTAALPDVIESNNGDDEDDEDDGISIPGAGTSKHTHQTRSGSSKPGSGPSSFRSRTMSASSAASMIKRGRSRFRRDSNVLKSVVLKGEKSFVMQTEGKWYTYTAEEQAVAHRWVQEIKNVPIPTTEPHHTPIEN